MGDSREGHEMGRKKGIENNLRSLKLVRMLVATWKAQEEVDTELWKDVRGIVGKKSRRETNSSWGEVNLFRGPGNFFWCFISSLLWAVLGLVPLDLGYVFLEELFLARVGPGVL